LQPSVSKSDRPGLSIRAKLDVLPIEKISKEPLARHKQKSQSDEENPSTSNISTVQKSEVPKEGPIALSTKPSASGFQIYSDTQTSENTKTKDAKSVGNLEFKIYSDKQDFPQQDKKLTPPESGFSIFSDDLPKAKSIQPKENSPIPKVDKEGLSCATISNNFTIFSDSIPSTIDKGTKSSKNPSVGENLNFKIFSDFTVEDTNNNKKSKEYPPKPSSLSEKSKKSEILCFEDESIKRVASKKSQEEEDNEIMAVIGLQDSEDTTINTKLAKLDIDSMFCSPGTTPIEKQSNRLQLQQTIGELSDIKEASGDCDHSIFGTISTPYANSSSKQFTTNTHFLNNSEVKFPEER